MDSHGIAMMVGTGVGASMGILLKGGAALETVQRISTMVFDKTGTVTMAKPAVSQCRQFSYVCPIYIYMPVNVCV